MLSSTGATAPSGPSAGEALPQDKLRHTAGEIPERLSGPGWTGLPFTREFHSSIFLPREQTKAHQEEGFPQMSTHLSLTFLLQGPSDRGQRRRMREGERMLHTKVCQKIKEKFSGLTQASGFRSLFN